MVQDWFRDCGSMVWARERVTTDSADEGRRCPADGYLLDVLEAFHHGCPWRERTGVCQMCKGTRVERIGMHRTGTSNNMIRLKTPQREVFLSPHRFRVLVAGRRFGKTYLANVELLRAASGRGRTAWYVAPTYRQAKRIAWNRLKELTRPYWASKPQESDLRIELARGGTIALRGADSYDSLRGEGLDFVVLDEFASMAPAAWKEVLRPALADRQGGALFIGTPRGYNHFYDLYESAQGNPIGPPFALAPKRAGTFRPRNCAVRHGSSTNVCIGRSFGPISRT
jgi:hypothetical protein